MSDASQGFSVEIDASVADCVAVLVDFPRYPEWSSPIESCRVLEQEAEGRGRIVEFLLDMKIKTVRYVLDYAYELPGGNKTARATWHLVEGDVSAVDGAYEFEPLEGGRTRATCRQTVDLGFWVPGPLRRVFERQALRDSVTEFMAAAEQRRRPRK